MKKSISMMLVLGMMLQFMNQGFFVAFSTTATIRSTGNFVKEAVDLIDQYDRNKSFIVQSAGNDSNDSLTLSSSRKMLAKDPEISNSSFQTCRLIVKAPQMPDKLNSVGMASGFKDWYIIQFENKEDAKAAYYYYLNKDKVLEVAPDRICDSLCEVLEETDTMAPADSLNEGDAFHRLSSWGSISTGLYDMTDYIEATVLNPQELVVGLIDTGINYDLGYFQNRLIRTYTNYLPSGEPNDEMDLADHGTGIAAAIVESTPENVKIAMYKAAGESGEASLALAFLQAVNDDVDIINCSFQCSNNSILHDAIDYAIEHDVVVIAASGNWGESLEYDNIGLPAAHEAVVSVAATANNDYPATWCKFGRSLDLLAPGEALPYLTKNGTVRTGSGTSLSAPLVSALFAQMMTLYPEMTNEEIERRIKSTASPTLIFYDCNDFGFGVIDAIAAAGVERLCAPVCDKEPGNYLDELSVELSAEPGTEIYYTLDQSYPSKEDGILYTGPIEMPDTIPVLRAVAYKNGCLKSKCASGIYRVQTFGTPDMFDYSNGMITGYHGDAHDVIIPELMVFDHPPQDAVLDDDDPRWEKIVWDIAPGAFSEAELYGVSIPALSFITELDGVFTGNPYLQAIDAPCLKRIGQECFANCTALSFVDCPEVEQIGEGAFRHCVSLGGISFPECNEAGDQAFIECISLRFINCPKLEYIGCGTFGGVHAKEINLPELHHLENAQGLNGDGNQFSGVRSYVLDLPNVNYFGKNALSNMQLERLELSKAQVIKGLMCISGITKNGSEQLSLSLVLPATLKTIEEFYPSEYLSDQPGNVIVYGNKGTYAEQWASENEYLFIEITPETAVITELPGEFYDYMRFLEADVVGFNRTYQWYGSYEDSNTGGFPIEGATEKRLIPKENAQFPFYYCAVTSKDVGFAPIEIRTRACRYMDFSGTWPAADYSLLDTALCAVPQDLTQFTEASADALRDVLQNQPDRSLTAEQQEVIDAYVQTLQAAITALVLRNPETAPPSVWIRQYEPTRTVPLFSGITFTAKAENAPEGSRIYWIVDGEWVATGRTYTRQFITKSFSVQAHLTDQNGRVLAKSGVETVKVSTEFFSWLAALFRSLFDNFLVISQSFHSAK